MMLRSMNRSTHGNPRIRDEGGPEGHQVGGSSVSAVQRQPANRDQQKWSISVAEGLGASEVGNEIAEHREHAPAEHAERDSYVAILEAVLPSAVALPAAWSGYLG
jgi:hypothetical protein